MAGLVEYASSDEEEEGVIEQKVMQAPTAISAASTKQQEAAIQAVTTSVDRGSQIQSDAPGSPVAIGPVLSATTPLGPTLGPSFPPLEESLANEPDATTQTPSSPYSANRAMLRDLTLPAVPNFDIPPSPPGSPPPGANKKFEQFLELKKKGVHFNAKLEQSSALKNPSLMDKLMDFAEIDLKSQYSTTLSTELWDPNSSPEWATRENLKKAHEKTAKEKEAEKVGGRSAIDFVPSTIPASASASGAGPSRGEKRKSGWN